MTLWITLTVILEWFYFLIVPRSICTIVKCMGRILHKKAFLLLQEFSTQVLECLISLEGPFSFQDCLSVVKKVI